MTQGGYRHCACRDCCEVTMTTGIPEHDLCHGCHDAGCSRDGDAECDALHTYCEGDDGSDREIWSAAADGAPVFEGVDARDLATAYAHEHGIKGLTQFCGVCGLEF